MGLIQYLGSGDPITADQMDGLVTELDSELSALFSGKSPLCFFTLSELQQADRNLLSLPFYLGNPAKRKILSGVSSEYIQDTFDTIVATLQVDSLNSVTKRWVVKDTITPAQWESVRAMFGELPIGNISQLGQSWPLDFSLVPYRHAISGQVLWYQFLPDAGREVRPWEHLHDHAVAEIILEGLDSPTFAWPREWSKFGCLRFHNLDAKPVDIVFSGLGEVVKIEAFGCRSVRLTGADTRAQRTGLDASLRYFWRFIDGVDQPIYDAPRNRNAGVWGTTGFNPIRSVPIMHSWLSAFLGVAGAERGLFVDPRVLWDGSSEYAGMFGPVDDSTTLARFAIHGGTVRSVMTVDGELSTVEDSVAWQGSALTSQTLAFSPSGRTVTITSKAAGQHDVAPISTNILGETVHAMEGTSASFTVGSGSFSITPYAPEERGASAQYYDPDWNMITVTATWELAAPGFAAFDLAHPFATPLRIPREMKPPGATEPDTTVSTYGDREFAFDGRALWMSWSVDHSISRPFTVPPGSLDPATFELSETKWTTHHATPLVQLLAGYDVLTARLSRFLQDAPGYPNAGNWIATDHPDVLSGDPTTGATRRLRDPAATETEIMIHGAAPAGEAVREHSLYPYRSNHERAVAGLRDPVAWQENRAAILAGTLTVEDRRRVIRIHGAVEHFNLLAARINSVACIRPYQITDLIYYGRPFAEASAGVSITPRHAKRLDNDDSAAALAGQLGLQIHTTSEIVNLARWQGVDASEWLGPNRTWLYGLLPLVGWPASNSLPDFRWLEFADLAGLARRCGLPYFAQRVSAPMRVGVYETPGEDTSWSYFSHATQWFSREDADFVVPITELETSEIANWRSPVAYTDSASDSIELIRAQFPTPAATGDHPFGQREAIRIDVAEEIPTAPSGWTWENRSRVLLQPMPHFRYAGAVAAGSGASAAFAAIVAEAQPPVTARAVPISDAVPDGTGAVALNPDTIRALSWPGSEEWAGRSMVWVTVVPSWGFWRAG